LYIVILCAGLSVAMADAVGGKSTAQSSLLSPPAVSGQAGAANTAITTTTLPETAIPVFSHLPASADTSTAPKQLTAWDVINKLLKLILVLIVMYVAILLLKKAQQGQLRLPLPGNSLFAPPSRRILLLETITLGQGRAVHLIAVGQRYLLLGATNQQVALLDDVTEAVPDSPETPVPVAPAPPAFLTMFSQAAAKYAPPTE